MDLATVVNQNSLNADLLNETREYPDPVALASDRLPWNIAVQILGSGGAKHTIAYHLAALSIADSIYKPWGRPDFDFAAFDWVCEGDWTGSEIEEVVQGEWEEYNGG